MMAGIVGGAGAHVEGRAVARTDRAVALKHALIERAAVMRTHVVDSIE